MTREERILALLPYEKPFLFVDSIDHISDDRVEGTYQYRKDEFFYKGHFPDNPITPGVILTETAAQIGLVALGIHLILDKGDEASPLFSSSQVDFIKPVYPGEKVRVIGEKEYFRFNKLKCKAKMLNEEGEVVCEGYLSGFIVPQKSSQA